jgi:hypothetical protein
MRDHVLDRAGLRPGSEPQLIASDSNETWRFDDGHLGPVVLRIAWRGDVTRLLREAAVGSRLPDEVPYPELLGSGSTEYRGRGLTWTVTRRLDGMTLVDAWPLLPAHRRRAAAAELAGILRSLHTWRPPKEVVDALLPRTPWDPGDCGSLIGGDLNPLPIERVRALLPCVDAAAHARIADVLTELAPFAPRWTTRTPTASSTATSTWATSGGREGLTTAGSAPCSTWNGCGSAVPCSTSRGCWPTPTRLPNYRNGCVRTTPNGSTTST